MFTRTQVAFFVSYLFVVFFCYVKKKLNIQTNSIIHRSLTPTNVLLTSDQSVLVTDYGLCDLKDDYRYRTKQIGRMPAYIAPEMYPCDDPDMLANGRYDHKVDIYSFGILVW